MGTIYTSVEQLIGRTPLLELRQIQRAEGLNATLLAKLEYLNPAGSAKDRVAKAMLDDAESKGLLKPGAVIIEEGYFKRRLHHHRTHLRQHGHWPGRGRRHPGLPHHHRHARHHEHGAPPAHVRLRR